jgi:hypothetical protein
MANLRHSVDFQEGGSGHLGKWRHNSAFAISELSMFFPFFEQILSVSGDEWLVHSIALVC